MLVLFFIPVKFSSKITKASYTEILLLTDGAGNRGDSFSNYKRITTIQHLSSAQTEFVPDLSTYLLRHHEEISSIHILGKGIGKQEWDLLNRLNIQSTYIPPSAPEGIINADWPRMIRQGEKFEIHGTYNNRANEDVKLVLAGLGTAFDSVIIKKDSSQTFYLSCQPAHIRQTVYEVQTITDTGLVAIEKTPVTIKESAKPTILVLSSSPGFENKFLGQWLHEHNYPTAIRNKISRDKFDHQFLNMKAIALNNLNASILENFDLLIADDYALAEINSNTTALIKAKMEQGMGLIIQSDTTTSLSTFSRSFVLKKQATQKTATRSLTWRGSSSSPLLAAEQWFKIQNDPLTVPLVMGDQQSVVTSCRLYGSGKLIMNTATSTFGWLLSGNEENYSSFWSLLISQAARTRKPVATWYTEPAFPSSNHQVKLLLETDSRNPPVIKTASGEVYTAQTPYLPDTWTADWWPTTPGWQTLSSTDTTSIYVFEDRDWSAAKQQAQINNNIMMAGQQRATLKKTNTLKTERKTVPVYIFFMVFIVACGSLWWEAKQR